jgi:predicted RNA polymerase sigma factor
VASKQEAVEWAKRLPAVRGSKIEVRRVAGVDALIALDRLPGSHLVPTVRAELLARLGRRPEARIELELAARLCANQRERSVLLRKVAALTVLVSAFHASCTGSVASGVRETR